MRDLLSRAYPEAGVDQLPPNQLEVLAQVLGIRYIQTVNQG